MLMTLTALASPDGLSDATELGFLLHKNPGTLFERPLSFGTAHAFYPEATPSRCTLALWVALDPIRLVRGRADSVFQYVNDRPYVASSFLSVALSECFSTALAGRSKERPELVDQKLPLTVGLSALACDGGEALVRRLLEPLGYTVELANLPLDPRFPEWGESHLYSLTLTGLQTVHDLLSHLYVVLPALDNAKHYLIGDDEVEKLLRHGEGWLAIHPERELISRRYLRYKRSLLSEALLRLASLEETEATTTEDTPESAPKARLNDQRIEAILDHVRATQPPPERILDLGCGEGKTLRALRIAFPRVALTGMDVSSSALQIAARRLKTERDTHLTLLHGSLLYRDDRLTNHDLALLMEVIEHLDLGRLSALETTVFAHARPRRVLLTTPNAEYNMVWKSLPAGAFRHSDHRFEWTRAELQTWAERVATENGYRVAFEGIGDPDPDGRGSPTQLAIFDR